MTAPIAVSERSIAPRTDSSASRFCGGTSPTVVRGSRSRVPDQTCRAAVTSRTAHRGRATRPHEQGKRNTCSHHIPCAGRRSPPRTHSCPRPQSPLGAEIRRVVHSRRVAAVDCCGTAVWTAEGPRRRPSAAQLRPRRLVRLDRPRRRRRLGGADRPRRAAVLGRAQRLARAPRRRPPPRPRSAASIAASSSSGGSSPPSGTTSIFTSAVTPSKTCDRDRVAADPLDRRRGRSCAGRRGSCASARSPRRCRSA